MPELVGPRQLQLGYKAPSDAAASYCRGLSGLAGSASGRRFETVIAEILLQLLDPPLNEGNGVVRAGNIDRLAVASEPKDRVACVRAGVAEYPLHRCEVAVRRED